MKKHEGLQASKKDFLAEHGLDKIKYKDGKPLKTDTVIVVDPKTQLVKTFVRELK
jgi:hypothetical protein